MGMSEMAGSQDLKSWQAKESLGIGEADMRWMKRRRESGDDGFMAIFKARYPGRVQIL